MDKNFFNNLLTKFQIRDENGNIVDRNLSYEAALLYIDSSVGKYYVMEPMKKEDEQKWLWFFATPLMMQKKLLKSF